MQFVDPYPSEHLSIIIPILKLRKSGNKEKEGMTSEYMQGWRTHARNKGRLRAVATRPSSIQHGVPLASFKDTFDIPRQKYYQLF